MGEILKKIADRYNSLSIKRGEKKKCEEIRDFLALLKEYFPTTVGTVVKESCLEKKKQKDCALPSTEDVKLLTKYINNQRFLSYLSLKEEFSFKVWKDLASYTLLYSSMMYVLACIKYRYRKDLLLDSVISPQSLP